MAVLGEIADLGVEIEDNIAMVEIKRPPFNYFDMALIRGLADAFEALDQRDDCRAIVLCAEGKAFCAGANFGDGSRDRAKADRQPDHLYIEAVRLFRCKLPVVGAIQGASVGGGLGLALVPDFRVACPEARFSANFTRLGFHPGFGLTATLPRVIGPTKAAMMFYTSRRIKGEEAYQMGLADMLVARDELRGCAIELAREITHCSPLGVAETRATMRQGLADAVEAATDHELEIQNRLRETDDFAEGIAAMAARRIPNFQGR